MAIVHDLLENSPESDTDFDQDESLVHRQLDGHLYPRGQKKDFSNEVLSLYSYQGFSVRGPLNYKLFCDRPGAIVWCLILPWPFQILKM